MALHSLTMVSFSWSAFLLLVPLVSASAVQRRGTMLCGQYETFTSGSYTLFTDLWGERGASSGSQCSTLESVDGNTVQWSTTWTWTGGTGIKSFSNIQLNAGVNQQLSAINSMPVRFLLRNICLIFGDSTLDLVVDMGLVPE